MGTAEWLLLLLLSVLWGGSFLFAKVAVGELPPMTVAFLRVAIAALALYAIVRATGQSMPVGRDWFPYLVMGAINNVIPFTLLFWAMTEVSSGLAAILNAATPLFTVVLAHFLTQDERLSVAKLSGVLVGLVGVAVLIGVDALGGLGVSVIAQLACVAAAVAYALAGIWGRRFRGRPPVVVAAGQVTASSVLMLPLVALADQPWRLAMPSLTVILSVLALAIVSTALAYVIYFRILKVAGATNLLLVTFLIPVSAMAFGVALLGETVTLNNVFGMILIGIGLAAIDGRPVSWLAVLFGNRRRPA